MTMYESGHAGPGITGAKTTSWEHANPRDMVIRLRRQYPGVNASEITERVRDLVLGDKPEYLVPFLLHTVRNILNALDREEDTQRRREERERTREQRIAKQIEQVGQAETAVTEHVRKEAEIMLLDLTAPNGKLNRHCTGAECRHFGGWYSRLADRVGDDNLVGDKVSEQDVRQLYSAAA